VTFRPTARTVVLLSVVLMAQAPSEPYPGQREHKEPPEGFFCSRLGEAQDAAHTCWCSGMSHDPMCKKDDPQADDPATDQDESQPTAPPDDAKCTTYCYRARCLCKVLCKDSVHY
jgi:hypothetical protein